MDESFNLFDYANALREYIASANGGTLNEKNSQTKFSIDFEDFVDTEMNLLDGDCDANSNKSMSAILNTTDAADTTINKHENETVEPNLTENNEYKTMLKPNTCIPENEIASIDRTTKNRIKKSKSDKKRKKSDRFYPYTGKGKKLNEASRNQISSENISIPRCENVTTNATDDVRSAADFNHNVLVIGNENSTGNNQKLNVVSDQQLYSNQVLSHRFEDMTSYTLNYASTAADYSHDPSVTGSENNAGENQKLNGDSRPQLSSKNSPTPLFENVTTDASDGVRSGADYNHAPFVTGNKNNTGEGQKLNEASNQQFCSKKDSNPSFKEVTSQTSNYAKSKANFHSVLFLAGIESNAGKMEQLNETSKHQLCSKQIHNVEDMSSKTSNYARNAADNNRDSFVTVNENDAGDGQKLNGESRPQLSGKNVTSQDPHVTGNKTDNLKDRNQVTASFAPNLMTNQTSSTNSNTASNNKLNSTIGALPANTTVKNDNTASNANQNANYGATNWNTNSYIFPYQNLDYGGAYSNTATYDPTYAQASAAHATLLMSQCLDEKHSMVNAINEVIMSYQKSKMYKTDTHNPNLVTNSNFSYKGGSPYVPYNGGGAGLNVPGSSAFQNYYLNNMLYPQTTLGSNPRPQ